MLTRRFCRPHSEERSKFLNRVWIVTLQFDGECASTFFSVPPGVTQCASAMASQFAGEPEQRRLGANGVDVIDELCEASIFDEAAKYLSNTKLKLTNDQKLSFYALFKQATIGPCNIPKPSLLNMYDRAKWNAWNDLKKMSKDEAITRYVKELEKVVPSWREQSGAVLETGSDEESSGGGGGGLVAAQSRPVFEAEADLLPSQQTIHTHAQAGDVSEVKKAIKDGKSSVNAKDEEGRTALHWAVDRSHEELVRVLLKELGADVNAQVRNSCGIGVPPIGAEL
jgi:acyl-CoA-binding protein